MNISALSVQQCRHVPRAICGLRCFVSDPDVVGLVGSTAWILDRINFEEGEKEAMKIENTIPIAAVVPPPTRI